jgi:hypothetical protein
MIVRALRKPTKYRPSGPKLPPPGFRLQSGQCRAQGAPCEVTANTRSAPLFTNRKFSVGSTARPRGSVVRSSSIKVPRRLPSNSKATSAKSVPINTGCACNEKGHLQQSPRPPAASSAAAQSSALSYKSEFGGSIRSSGLDGGSPSIHGKLCAINETRAIRGQEHDRLGNLVGCGRTARRSLGG